LKLKVTEYATLFAIYLVTKLKPVFHALIASPSVTATQRRGDNRLANRIDFSVHNLKTSKYAAQLLKSTGHGGHQGLGQLVNTARPFYFVTFNTYKRYSLLARPEVHEAFCMFCSKAQEHDVAVGRYVIMPNHVHLFGAFPMNGS
jgi:hypothetical protein